MADRRYNDTTIGNPGRLEYFPPGVRRAEEQGWLTSRNHESNVPKLRELGSHREWLASTTQRSPLAPSGRLWNENRKQKKWLSKSHPEAALGNQELEDILAAETSSRGSSPPSTWQLAQFALGEMADTSDGRKVVGVPLLTMAAGSAGDVLRFVRPAANPWQLGDNSDAVVRLLEHDKHQETLWTKDIGVIHRIKAIVSTKKYEPVRWVAVQREFGTSIFRPEYQKAPVVSETFSGTGPQAPSHIAPNLLFTIPKSQTGHSAHCDVAFNPGVRLKPAQLAVIDAGGCWSVWDVTGTRGRVYKHPKTRLSKCGSLTTGVRDWPSQRPAANPQWHRILWVGRSAPDDEDDFVDEDADAPQTASLFPSLERSSILLLCNQKSLRLLDLETNDFLPDIRFVPDGSRELILGVEVDSQDTRYLYVVTSVRVFVVAVFASEDRVQQQVTRKALVLQSFPHLRSRLGQGLKVTVMAGPSSLDDRTALVVLYSECSSWHDVFCIKIPRKHPEWVVVHHGHLASQDGLPESVGRGLQTLCLSPVSPLPRQPSESRNLGHVQSGQEPSYFQLFSFRTDLSLSYCLGTTSTTYRSQDILPMHRIPEAELMTISGVELRRSTKLEKFSRQEIERRRAIRYLSTRFVVADSIAEFRYGDGAPQKKVSVVREPTRKPIRRMIEPVYETLQSSLVELCAEGDGTRPDMDVYGAAPFDPVFVTLQEALETKTLAQNVLYDLVESFRMPQDYRELSQDWQAEIEQLRHLDPALHVSSIDGSPRIFDTKQAMEDLFSKLVSLTLRVDPIELEADDSNGFTFLVLGRMSCELFLARNSMAYLPLEVMEPPMPPAADFRSSPLLMPEDMLIDSQGSVRSTTRSSSLALDSQSSSRASTPASMATSVATEVPASHGTQGAGVGLIQALTGSQLSLQKRPWLPSAWNLDEDFSQTVFDVEKTTEVTEGERRRAKQEAREARKRKRAETLRQLQREHNLLPSTQPVSRTGFYTQVSQPMSDFPSQSRVLSSAPPIAMSQPVAGMFGGRSDFDRPKKKPKRKGGF
ncbi:putative RNA polymerase I-specific transcription initiation factor RRN6-like protein [Seiridium unicorne]|uniref:RNA polymerase I-specific transcription initiation factor RRN6-like protein n=1 Tax=Seiridium unicorne TaxID=138068 RepID=A0ABR2UU65_9PEZI